MPASWPVCSVAKVRFGGRSRDPTGRDQAALVVLRYPTRLAARRWCGGAGAGRGLGATRERRRRRGGPQPPAGSTRTGGRTRKTRTKRRTRGRGSSAPAASDLHRLPTRTMTTRAVIVRASYHRSRSHAGRRSRPRSRLGRRRPIGTADYLIAGICLTRGGVLLTRNRDHFERVSGLNLGKV